MSEVDSIGTAYYYSGVQNSASAASKNKKTEKADKTKRASFTELLKTKKEEPSFKTIGLPPEIQTMTIEEAAVFLKDAVDMAGNDLANENSRENLEKFKKSVSQLISFVVANNYEVNTKKPRRPRMVSPVGAFSNYNTTPHVKDPQIVIKTINEKLDALVRETMATQALQGNFRKLEQIDEIKGLVVDLLSS